MNSESHIRDEALRRMLVATIDSAPVVSRQRWRVVVASAATFALAGALTGGALASVATANNNVEGYAPFEIGPPPILDDDAEILSTPMVLTGRGPGSIDLGAAPPDANALALAIYCLENGAFRTNLDGEFVLGLTCTAEPGDPDGGGAGIVPTFDGELPREITVEADSGAYAVWVAWVDQPADAEPSAAQQEALADGIVTRDEYAAGYQRYVACMAELGFVVDGRDTGEGIIGYVIPGSTGNSGAANRCYEAEFYQLDSTYQVSLED